MTTRPFSRVWVGRVLGAITALTLALAAAAMGGVSVAAMGHPPLLRDDPPAATATPALAPAAAVPACPSSAPLRAHATPGCPAPTPAATTAARRPSAVVPVTAAPPAAPVGSVPEPLPIPPPLWLTPSMAPVPQGDAAQLAPTSVLVLGFGSVAMASAALTLRLLRRGR